jgi:hypothetical protein
MDERQALERAACEHFLKAHNATHRTNFQIAEHRDKPDFLVRDARVGEPLGIEVMHLYYDPKEAQMVLGRRPNELHGVMTVSGLIAKFNVDVAEKLGRAAKYDFSGKMILLVRVTSPIFDKDDFDMHEDDISIPHQEIFSEVWLLFWDQASRSYSSLKQVY